MSRIPRKQLQTFHQYIAKLPLPLFLEQRSVRLNQMAHIQQELGLLIPAFGSLLDQPLHDLRPRLKNQLTRRVGIF